MEVAYERRMRMLETLSRRGACREDVGLSNAALAASCGLTSEQARSVMRSLRKEGFVRVSARKLPNGGTAENAYRLTPAGLAALSDMQDSGTRE